MCWLSSRVIWMVGGRQTRQTLRRRRGLFVALLLVILPCQLVFPPEISREDSLAPAIRRSLGSNPDVPYSVRRLTSHSVLYVQAVQSFLEHRYQPTSPSPSSLARLESHKPPRVAPILQTGVRSRSFTDSAPKFFAILSLPPYRKVKPFSFPSILLDGDSLPLRRSSTGNLSYGAEQPKSFAIRPMLKAIEVICSSIWTWLRCSFEPVRHTLYLQRPKSLEENLIRQGMSFGDWVVSLENSGGFTGFLPPCSTSLYLSCGKNLARGFTGSEKLLPPFSLSIERGVSSIMLLPPRFSSLIGLLSCVAVSTGPEDAIEITSVFLVDEVWTSTSHYVTILQLSDFVVKATLTHSSTVSNSLSSSIEDLSYLVYLCVVCYGYGQRGWIIPSIYCSDEV
ncbi:hypothetical protein Bca52824_069080 [Brassica carinata]|uniref:Uncharacterized protein n=1 Tax=Brassica carinata TaxID=52824 RepID=A0A8X7Q1P4_BRACI|nr:hypothetical protein Bca52824_069080 [Brassica carinata]